MAHFIEIDNRRCHIPGWGLGYGTYNSWGNRSWYEMTTTKAVEREIRTMGIQLVLNRHYKFPASKYFSEKRDSQHMADLTKWIQNWENYGYINGEYCKDYEPRALARIEERILEEMNKWSMHSLQIAWKLRIYHLRQKQKRGLLKTPDGMKYRREVMEYA